MSINNSKKHFVISGEAYYPNLRQLSPVYKKYDINVAKLSAESVALLEAGGIPVYKVDKTSKKTGEVILPAPYVTARSRKPVNDIVDTQKKVIPGDIMIGNGSKVNVAVNVYKSPEHDRLGLGISAVQIVELVEYEGYSGISSFNEVDGFEVSSATATEQVVATPDQSPLPFD